MRSCGIANAPAQACASAVRARARTHTCAHISRATTIHIHSEQGPADQLFELSYWSQDGGPSQLLQLPVDNVPEAISPINQGSNRFPIVSLANCRHELSSDSLWPEKVQFMHEGLSHIWLLLNSENSPSSDANSPVAKGPTRIPKSIAHLTPT